MLQAQKIVNVSGATMSGSQYNIEYSVGEIAINTITTSNKTITQGLLQPLILSDSCSALPQKPDSSSLFSNKAFNDIIISKNVRSYPLINDIGILKTAGVIHNMNSLRFIKDLFPDLFPSNYHKHYQLSKNIKI